MQITNDSCINFNLPEYKRLETLYGELSSIEIINYLSSNEFIDWYGYNMFPIITNHIVINNKGNIIDLRDKIEHTKYFYTKHLNDIKNNLSDVEYNNIVSGKISKKNDKLSSLLLTDNVNDDDINSLISDYLLKIHRKTFKTDTEKQILNGNQDEINRYFNLNGSFKYDNYINNDDNIVTIKHKLNNVFHNEYKTVLNNNTPNVKNISILDNLTYDSFYYDNTLYINSKNNDLNNLTFAKNLVKAIIYNSINISDDLFNHVKNNIVDTFDVMNNKEQFKEALFFNENFNRILKENNLLSYINSQLNTGGLFSYNKKEDKVNIYTDIFITQQKLEQCLI